MELLLRQDWLIILIITIKGRIEKKSYARTKLSELVAGFLIAVHIDSLVH
jgi:hypothetical protein